ncbi:MAG: HNH endonuclease [Bryobacteraceae bacterium]
MTRRRAEHLTGCEIKQLSAGAHPVTMGAFKADDLVATAKNLTERLALRDLVARVYRLHCLGVLKHSEGRCSRCGMPKRLQIHHKRYRSHGGTHEIANLEPVCWDCHRMIHELERSL